MNQSTSDWIRACTEWADESDWPAGLNGLFLEWEAAEEKALDQSMSTARWVQAYLEWAFEESGNVVHVARHERRDFDRRTAAQFFCGYVRRSSDRQNQANQRLAAEQRPSSFALHESLAA